MGIRLDSTALTDIPSVAPTNNTLSSVSPLQLEQKMTNWCWAACAELVITLLYPGKNVSQCLLAEQFAGVPNGTVCCPTNEDCNKPLDLQDIKDKVYDFYQIDSDILDELTLSNTDKVKLIKDEIAAQRPLEIYFRIKENSGHVCIVHGWFLNERNKLCLQVKNPAGSNDDGAYSLDRVNAKGWIAAITNIRPRPQPPAPAPPAPLN